MIEKQKSTLLKRRKIAIIAISAFIVLLIPTLIFVNYFVKTETIYDVDDTKYIIKYKDGSYSIYDTDGIELDVDDEYGYYVTASGTLIDLDSETGEYEIVAIVDTEGTEEVGHNSRILMFPNIEKKNIRSIEVVNDEGSFTFVRYNVEKNTVDDSCDFIIKGSPLVSFDQELFASLYVTAGYTLTTRKIQDPIKDANGEYTEYGLVSEMRVDEDGEEYAYMPAYYILTDTSGNKHKVIIGDMLVTGGGYYVQYVNMENGVEEKRDAVYVLSTTVGDTLLQPIETFVTPQIVYPMSMNNYFDVENFSIIRENAESENGYEQVVGFSYIDLSLRENTIEANFPYVFTAETLDGYTPDSDNINTALYALYDTAFVGVTKLSPTDSDLLKYGLAKESTDENGKTTVELASKYIMTFDFDLLDDDGEYESTIQQRVLISDKNEDGNYYAYTLVYVKTDKGYDFAYSYDMIVEIEGYSLEFLNWNSLKWINQTYIYLNIAYCEEVTLASPNYSASFDLDNSKSSQSNGTNSDRLEVIASDSNGNSVNTFSSLTVIDKDGLIWEITTSAINAYDSSGTKLTIDTAYYAYNKLGSQVRVVSGYIPCADGTRVYVTADAVTVTNSNDEVIAEYVRYATSLFRKFFQTMIASSIENSYEVTDEEESAIVTDENWLLTITITNSKDETSEYKFYSIPDSKRKAYITINGNGNFYVLSSRVQKFINDAQRFFALETIDPDAKN